jgi:hypothetical protein
MALVAGAAGFGGASTSAVALAGRFGGLGLQTLMGGAGGVAGGFAGGFAGGTLTGLSQGKSWGESLQMGWEQGATGAMWGGILGAAVPVAIRGVQIATWQARWMTARMTGNLVYRNLNATDVPHLGLHPRAPHRTHITPIGHIRAGSNPKYKGGPYISTTRSKAILQKWARPGLDQVRIDLRQVKAKIIDVSTRELAAKTLKGPAVNYAANSAEVLVGGSIPASAIEVLGQFPQFAAGRAWNLVGAVGTLSGVIAAESD